MPRGSGPRSLRRCSGKAGPVVQPSSAPAPSIPSIAFLARDRQGGYALSRSLQSPERRRRWCPPVLETSGKRRSLYRSERCAACSPNLDALGPCDQAPSEHDGAKYDRDAEQRVRGGSLFEVAEIREA